MNQIGLPNKLITHIYELYNARNVYIRTSDTLMGPRRTSMGLPQGSILRPLLYILYTYDFELLFPDTKIKVYQFADDYAIQAQEKNIVKCHQILDEALTHAKKWFVENGSPISQEKSSICTFTRSRFQSPNSITLSNLDI